MGVQYILSAVIYSSCATYGKLSALSSNQDLNILFRACRYDPNSKFPKEVIATKKESNESILDGLRVYHNPYATYPLDLEVFRSPEIFQAYYSYQENKWIYESEEDILLFRHSINFRK